MPTHSQRLQSPILALAVAGLAACGESTTAPVDHATLHQGGVQAAAGGASANAAGLARVVHAATARLHATAQATRAGYVVNSPCVASPAGGMGYHWLNGSLVDPSFDPLKPEVVLYEPDADGNLKLVAVEYIVIDVGQPAPTFAGQAFDVGGTPVPVAHWSLHVWLHKPNPNGMFTPFNPDVSCPAP